MNITNYSKPFPTLIVLLVVLLVIFIINSSFTSILSSDGQSVELGFSSQSPRGASGGSVIPASCGSPHLNDLCTPPTFDGTSGGGSGSNIPINIGDSATLSWSCAPPLVSSSGINFSTGGATSGQATVTPSSDTAYTLICSNGGQGTVNITILNPEISISAIPTLLQSGSTTVIAWTAAGVNSCSVSEDSPAITDSWTATSGTQTSSPIVEETTYTLTCQTDAGMVSESAIVRLVPVFQEF